MSPDYNVGRAAAVSVVLLAEDGRTTVSSRTVDVRGFRVQCSRARHGLCTLMTVDRFEQCTAGTE